MNGHLRAGVLVLAALAATACGRDPASRSNATATSPSIVTPMTPRLIVVVDGVTGAPVAGVRVHLAATSDLTDRAGKVSMPMPCAQATFVAAGFLERQVRCLLTTTGNGSLPVTLWPIAGDAEREALRQTAFPSGRLTLNSNFLPFYLSADVAAQDGAVAAWAGAAATVFAATRGRWQPHVLAHPSRPDPGDDAFLIDLSTGAPCAKPSTNWSAGRACYEPGPGYFQTTLRIPAGLVGRPDMALRALLYEIGLGLHSEPGLMNAAQPASELSPFERNTLAMIGLRAAITWPDSEP
ncbi:MAG: hypothetical protein ABI880_10765 [Acidobacteriota bacterium]